MTVYKKNEEEIFEIYDSLSKDEICDYYIANGGTDLYWSGICCKFHYPKDNRNSNWEIYPFIRLASCDLNDFQEYLLDLARKYKFSYDGENWEFLCYDIDGASQLPGEWRPIYYDERFIRIIIPDYLFLVIDRFSYDLKFFQIGEDDGYWFITTYHPGYWSRMSMSWIKLDLLSLISDLSLPDFDNQKVIEKIWGMDEFPFEQW